MADRITGLKPDQADAAGRLERDRGPWGIADGWHPVGDVMLGEEAGCVRRHHAPAVLAAVRNLVLGLLRPRGFPGIAAAT